MAKMNYQNDYPSVTTILGILRKIGLENWFKYTPIKQINEESNKGKLIGTQIHEAIHTYIETGKTSVKTEYVEEVSNALKSFIQFRKDLPQIKLRNAEIAMTSEIYKFNGTRDCNGDEETIPILLDWKTGKAKKKDKPDIYDEYKYQVAAYCFLYKETTGIMPQKAYILALAKDKIAYNLCMMDRLEIENCFNEVFLPTLRIWNYQNRKG